jgi:hypothetical protein
MSDETYRLKRKIEISAETKIPKNTKSDIRFIEFEKDSLKELIRI